MYNKSNDDFNSYNKGNGVYYVVTIGRRRLNKQPLPYTARRTNLLSLPPPSHKRLNYQPE